MSAPPPPGRPGSRYYAAPAPPADAGSLFAGAVFAAELERAAAARPYTRPGYPRWQLYTRAQWALFDELEAHHSRVEARYGRLFPELAGAVANFGRRIW